MSNFDVWSMNVHHSRSTSAIGADVRRIITVGADVICLQEMNGHRGAVEGLPGRWRTHRPARNSGEDIPILYNGNTFTKESGGSHFVSAEQHVEKAAGGAHVAEKTVTWLRLRHRATGRQIVFMNTHAVPSIESYGRPNEHNPRRVAVFAQLMETVTTMVNHRNRLGHATVLCGDLNVDYRHDSQVQDERFPYVTFDRVGLHASYRTLGAPTGGTHGDRLIDYVAYTPRPYLNAVAHEVHRGFGSDHRPVSAMLRVT